MTKKLAKFGEFSIEDADTAAKEANSGGDFIKMGEGKNIYRFLPPRAGEKPYLITSSHWIKNGPEGKSVTFNCPRAHARKPCPVCVIADRYNRSPSASDQEKAKELFARKRVFWNVIDRKSPNGPGVLGFPNKVLTSLIDIRKSEEAGGDFTNPVDGFDIVIIKSGSGMNTDYKVLPALKTQGPLAADPVVWQEWVETQPDLGRIVRLRTEDEIMDMLGLTSEDVNPTPVAQLAKPKRTVQDDAIDADFTTVE